MSRQSSEHDIRNRRQKAFSDFPPAPGTLPRGALQAGPPPLTAVAGPEAALQPAIYQGRPFALKRAFNNLVENAIKYATPPDIELVREPRAWVVMVRDRGPGIPETALGSVFLPYYRADKSRNRGTGGVGLGLTVAQAILHGHGGEITLENAPGGGLQARVVLPAA